MLKTLVFGFSLATRPRFGRLCLSEAQYLYNSQRNLHYKKQIRQVYGESKKTAKKRRFSRIAVGVAIISLVAGMSIIWGTENKMSRDWMQKNSPGLVLQIDYLKSHLSSILRNFLEFLHVEWAADSKEHKSWPSSYEFSSFSSTKALNVAENQDFNNLQPNLKNDSTAEGQIHEIHSIDSIEPEKSQTTSQALEPDDFQDSSRALKPGNFQESAQSLENVNETDQDSEPAIINEIGRIIEPDTLQEAILIDRTNDLNKLHIDKSSIANNGINEGILKAKEKKENANNLTDTQFTEQVYTKDQVNEMLLREREALQEGMLKELESIRKFSNESQLKIQENYIINLNDRLEEMQDRYNTLLMEKVNQMNKLLNSQVSNRVEKERSGRLAKLSVLETGMIKLEQILSNAVETVNQEKTAARLAITLDQLENSWNRGSVENIKSFISALITFSQNDKLLQHAIEALQPLENKVDSTLELVQKFEEISDKVLKISFLSQDSSAFQHATSWFFSKLLFKSEGTMDPQSVPSILNKSQKYLEIGDLDMAAREINQLKHWPRQFFSNWLEQARMNLQVKQAIRIIKLDIAMKQISSQKAY